MTVNLMFTRPEASDRAATDWAAILEVAPEQGCVWIDENTVNDIGRLLDGQRLTNGETVTAYAYEDDEPYAAMICAFGPSLLPTQVQDMVRDRLAGTKNGAQAARLFDLIITRGLQIRLNGAEHRHEAYIKAVNWQADDVEFNRTALNMSAMMGELGLKEEMPEGREIAFDRFAQAVEEYGAWTDRHDALKAFVACAKRNGATSVYWA